MKMLGYLSWLVHVLKTLTCCHAWGLQLGEAMQGIVVLYEVTMLVSDISGTSEIMRYKDPCRSSTATDSKLLLTGLPPLQISGLKLSNSSGTA